MTTVKASLRAAIVVCVLAGRCNCAFERQPESPRACGMGGAGLALPGNAWGALTNPAALFGTSGPILAVSWAPSPFGLRELGRSAFACVEPMDRITPSISGVRYGFELYRELTFGAGCAVDCGRGVRAGVSLTFNSLSVAGYGRGSCLGLDAGVLWEIVPGLSIGASAQNLNTPSPGRSGENIPGTFGAGIAYAGPGTFLLACDLVQDPRFPSEVRLGAEITAAEFLTLRAGVSTDPSTCSAGLSLRFFPVVVEYAFTRHQELGYTHRFGLSLLLGGA